MNQNNNNNILANLEKLLKSLEENQSIIDGLAKDSQPSVRPNRESVNVYNNSTNISMPSQSYNYIPPSQPALGQPNIPTQSLSQPHLQSSTGGINYYKSYYWIF